MREYEKKLHLDKHYEKMQFGNILQTFMPVFWTLLCYVILYLGLKYAQKYILDIRPWVKFREFFYIYQIPFCKMDVVYFLLGMLVTGYGSFRMTKITKENHSVREKDSDKPTSLLTDGYYAKVRHPMYGTFVLQGAGLFWSLRSFWGVLLAITIFTFQHFNAYYEEQRILLPLFGEEYRNYIRKVRYMLFQPWENAILILLLLMHIAGLII
ncbi:MAG: isoprenylcysteine carboxylmethyltransferase family protein [Lachnospiraceae bacterium]|nr:isoprenylcysteine carboxylmethyltransferase family protein [Lachnospiraceae bacterium]